MAFVVTGNCENCRHAERAPQLSVVSDQEDPLPPAEENKNELGL